MQPNIVSSRESNLKERDIENNIFSISSAKLQNKNKKYTMKRPIVNAILLILTLGLAWACYQSIHSDIAFDEIKAQREQLVKNRLWEIRSAEEQFKMVNGHFCGTIDSLIDWVKNERAIDHIVKEGELSDDQLESGMTEVQAVRQGLIKRDTVWVSAAERLGIANPDSMKYVPIELKD